MTRRPHLAVVVILAAIVAAVVLADTGARHQADTPDPVRQPEKPDVVLVTVTAAPTVTPTVTETATPTVTATRTVTRAARSATRTSPPAAAEGKPSGRGYAKSLVPADQWPCLDKLWQAESGWDHTATNSSSGAYGIPQAYPASKLASAGADWRTNPRTQVRWGLSYIEDRYGSPCAAWAFFTERNYY